VRVSAEEKQIPHRKKTRSDGQLRVSRIKRKEERGAEKLKAKVTALSPPNLKAMAPRSHLDFSVTHAVVLSVWHEVQGLGFVFTVISGLRMRTCGARTSHRRWWWLFSAGGRRCNCLPLACLCVGAPIALFDSWPRPGPLRESGLWPVETDLIDGLRVRNSCPVRAYRGQ